MCLYFFVIYIVSLTAQSNNNCNKKNIPHLKRQGSTMQLVVNGKPLLMLAGETGNSSASDLKYMDIIWAKIVKMHLNTLVVPVYWDLIEPKEGTFNFTLVDIARQIEKIKLGDYVFSVHHEYSWPYAPKTEGKNPRYCGMIIMISPNEYYIAGRGMIVTFESAAKDGTIAGIGSMEEGQFINGKWIPGLHMNGDQSHQGRHMDLPGNTFSIQKVLLYKYK